MRRQLFLYINGKPHWIEGKDAFLPLSDYLRYQLQLTGTKVVCAEGDCGACTVLLGRLTGNELSYQAVNSCIQFMYQLDCTHIITIEGLKENGKLNPVQEAMVQCHGAQCGYCTPGIVVALCGQFMAKPDPEPVTERVMRDTLTGNLCRCTGYEPIIKAGCSVNAEAVTQLPQLYPSQDMQTEFAKHQTEPLLLEWENRTFFRPVSVEQAVQFKQKNTDAVWLSGGTDIGVICNKRNFEPASLISVSQIAGLDGIVQQDNQLVVGARATLSQLESASQELIPELSRMLFLFGAPQIKNAGTLAGNIANGSPIGDTLPFLFVVGAEIEATGIAGSRRININQFYKGYKSLALQPDELITRIFIPLPQPEETLKLYKVSRRRNLDISTFMAAFRMTVAQGRISAISIAYGGVGPTILRLPQTETFLTGKPLSEQVFITAGQHAVQEITPQSDVRGSQDFRKQLAKNILLKFYHEVMGADHAHATEVSA
jgi:xanthine dehydrogenase small subunit